MKHEKIVLWGTGKDAIDIYHRLRKKYEIVCFVDNYPSKRVFFDRKVYTCDEFLQSSYSDYFIVIATMKYMWEIIPQLEDLGKKILTDFFPGGFFDSNLIDYLELRKFFVESDAIRILKWHAEKRKIAILYGNCQMSRIGEMLSRCEEFSRQYLILLIPPAHMFENEKLYPIMKEQFWQVCSLFICQHVSTVNRFSESLATSRLVNNLERTCLVIYIPNVYFLGYFPQHPLGGDRCNVDVSLHQSGRFPYGDRFADVMMGKGFSPRDTVDTLMSEDFLGKDEICSIAEASFTELEKRERECNVRISDYLRENYCDHQLFYSPNHPVNEVLEELAWRIVEYLGLAFDRRNSLKEGLASLEGAAMPVYPCVIKSLKLKSYFTTAYANTGLWQFKSDVAGFLREYIRVCWENGRRDM